MKVWLAVGLGIVFILIGTPGYAQGTWGVGVTGGVNFAKVAATTCRVDEEPCDLDYQAGFIGGVFAMLTPRSPRYAFEPELLFAMKGGRDTEGSKGRNRINYIDIPLLARVNLSVGTAKPFVVVGPSFGLRLSAKDSRGHDITDDIKTLDTGIIFGGGVDITSMIGVEARFEQSMFDQLTDTGRKDFGVLNEPDKKFNNRAISILVDINLSK